MRKSGAVLKEVLGRVGFGVPVACLALAAGVVHGQAAVSSPGGKTFTDMVNTRCVKCHNADDWAGGVAMDTMDLSHAGQNPEVWEKAIAKLSSRLMPPAGVPQPAQPDVDAVVNYLEATVDAAANDKRVGHVPIQRLSRAEFAASVKDLVGVEVDPKQILPTEIEVDGFSNIAGALVISPSFIPAGDPRRRELHARVSERWRISLQLPGGRQH
jgi:hypothetical protein